MKVIYIPVRASSSGLKLLESKGLIRLLRPTEKVINTRTKTGAVDFYYKSNPEHGGHSLLAVGKRNTDIMFNYHPDNEDFILINPGKIKYKPLYFIASFLKAESFLSALRKGGLKQKDFIAVELEFNRPETAVFTALKNTVHCEITTQGKGRHPVFFASEPSKLQSNKLEAGKYKFILRGGQ